MDDYVRIELIRFQERVHFELQGLLTHELDVQGEVVDVHKVFELLECGHA
jgi:hypothetical protein